MKDMVAHLEKLRADAAECAMIRDLAVDQRKRELFARLAEHLQVLANESSLFVMALARKICATSRAEDVLLPSKLVQTAFKRAVLARSVAQFGGILIGTPMYGARLAPLPTELIQHEKNRPPLTRAASIC